MDASALSEARETPALVLTGPTGAGKSDWAERLAGELPIEVVSVDSALVYRGMDIGTAKPDAALRARIPHHLIDIRDPAEPYSAGEFVTDCSRLIGEIHGRGRIPLLVGGTMLYLRALTGGLAELPRGSAPLRREIDARAAAEGWASLHAELARLDPEAAARIHPNDPQRIQRALEVCRLAGMPLSQLQRRTRPSASGLPRWALVPGDRGALHGRIAQRFAGMMENGFLAEVERLRTRRDLTARHPALRAVGYRQLWAHLDGQYGIAEARERALAATRQLAKRQLTWLRSDSQVRWIDPLAPGAYESWKCELRRELGRAWPAHRHSW
ncbi:MAG: tRNA (adenosine(37)-N6)-dimethylallyltransferase MiaA [Steroidobacteraceae bacterium]